MMNLNPKLYYPLVFVAALVLYANTLGHQYVLDDGLVIEHNTYTQKGISGIPALFSSDTYAPFYQQQDAGQQLTGGRYRPLSLATFALEISLFGQDPFFGHLGNVVLYGLTLMLLLFFSREYIFKENPAAALAAVLVFAFHPLHTEVVANIKSRDEILSLLFILATLISLLNYARNKGGYWWPVGLLAYASALFSKEYGLTLVLLVPLALYLFTSVTVKRTVLVFASLAGVVALYGYARISAVGFSEVESTSVLNDPYFYATPAEALATKVFVLLKYALLHIWPYPLTYEYSYAMIEYRSWTSWDVWVSVVLHLGMILLGIRWFLARSAGAFLVFFYLGNLFMVSNLWVDIGGTMGERLIYHSSVAAAIGSGYLLRFLKPASQLPATAGLLLLFGLLTIGRNGVWENNKTLYLNDVEVSTKSNAANSNAGATLINLGEETADSAKAVGYVLQGVKYLERAIEINPDYIHDHLNLSLGRFLAGDLEGATDAVEIAGGMNKDHPKVKEMLKIIGNQYVREGLKAGINKDYKQAIELFTTATRCDGSNPSAWYHLGGAYYEDGNFFDARGSWAKAIELDPSNENAIQGFKVADQKLRKRQAAAASHR